MWRSGMDFRISAASQDSTASASAKPRAGRLIADIDGIYVILQWSTERLRDQHRVSGE
jgi:hypothetical protein